MLHCVLSPYAIDGASFLLLGLLLALMSGATSSTEGMHTAGFQVGNGSFLVLLLILFVYYIGCEELLDGTPGKLALSLRIIGEEGGPITWGASIVRNLIRIVEGLFFYRIGQSPSGRRPLDSASATVPSAPPSCARSSRD